MSSLTWLLLASSYGIASAGLSDLPKSQISRLPFTCVLPMEENQELFNTEVGKALWTSGVDLKSTFPGAAREAAYEFCDERIIPEGEPPDEAGRTRAQYVQICTDGLSTQVINLTLGLLTECNTTRVQELCEKTEAGKFCFKAGGQAEGDTCVLTRLNDGEKEAFTTECMEGFYCGGGQTDPKVCQKGKYCPESSVAPSDCKPGHTCIFANYQAACTGESDPILDGTLCEQDRDKRILLPDVCKQRYFCVGGTRFPCEEGHFCPDGSNHQHRCGRWESCPPQSYFPGRLAPSLIYTGANVVQLVAVTLALNENFCGSYWKMHGFFMLSWFLIFAVTESSMEDGWLPEHVSFLILYAWGVLWVSVLAPALGLGPEYYGIKSIMLNAVAIMVGFFFVFSMDGSYFGVLILAILVPAYYLNIYVMTDSDSYVWLQVTMFAASIAGLTAITILFQPAFGLQVVTITLLMLVPLLFSPLLGTLKVLLSLRHKEEFKEVEVQVDKARTMAANMMETTTSRREKLKGEMVRRDFSLSPKFSSKSTPTSRGKADLRSLLEAPLRDLELPQVKEEVEMSNMITQQHSFPAESGGARAPAIGLTLRDMSLLLRNGTTILDNINLTIPPSSACAVMGPSGSGKSSITNVLSGRAGYGVVIGDILVNGKDDIPLKELRGVTGFVPQDDVMNRELTCLENVAFQAKMRLPVASRQRDLKWAEKQSQQILKNFGLAHVKHSRIGDEHTRGISGGQRKRVSIAMEFICQPALLFLDEPTTGLDSTTSHRVVELVTQYAHDMHCTTTAVIHQPRFETLMLFDYIILLATGGYLTYAGPTKDVVKYFSAEVGVPFPEQANPADILMDAMSLDSAKVLAQDGKMSCPNPDEILKDTTSFGVWLASVWRGSANRYTPPEQTDVDCPVPDLFPELTNVGEMVIIQIRRATLQLQRAAPHTASMAMLLGIGTFVICVAIPGQQFLMQFFFHLAIALLFLMLSSGVAAQRVFGGAERVVAWREAGVNVKMSYYFIGRDVVSLVEVCMFATVFTSIYWWGGPLFIDFRELLWASFAFIYAAFGYGFLWSILLDSSTAQMVAISTSFIFFFLTGMQPGFASLIDVAGGALVYLMSFSPPRWAHGYLVYAHMLASEGSQFVNPLVNLEQEFILEGFGVVVNENFAKVCIKGEGPANVLAVWTGDPSADGKPMAYNCSTQQLFFLGIFLRFVCCLALIATSKTQATGGGALFEGRSRGLFGELTGPVLNLVFWAFLVVLATCEISLLLLTK